MYKTFLGSHELGFHYPWLIGDAVRLICGSFQMVGFRFLKWKLINRMYANLSKTPGLYENLYQPQHSFSYAA